MNELATIQNIESASKSDKWTGHFKSILGQSYGAFLANIVAVVNGNSMLQKASVESVMLAAAQAAACGLSITTGEAALVPYKGQCQLQIMRDGWVAMAVRTNMFRYIVNEPVYDGELVRYDRFTDDYEFDASRRVSGNIIGFMARFELVSGYRKTVFWDIARVNEHALKYSRTAVHERGLWQTNYNEMALKTVLKHLLKKYAPKSMQISCAIAADQAAFEGDIEDVTPVYVDNLDPELENARNEAQNAPDMASLTSVWYKYPQFQQKPEFKAKMTERKNFLLTK